MKKEQIKVGETYWAKVSGGVVHVRITGEKWTGDKHTGWTAVNTKTNHAVRIKSAQRLRSALRGGNEASKADHEVPSAKEAANNAAHAPAAPSAPVAPAPAKGSPTGQRGAKGAKVAPPPGKAKAPKAAKPPKAKTPKPAKPKRLSALDAAAQVVATAKQPMRATDMIAQMEAKGLWKSPGGKTPEATLYAAVIREIAAKKSESRFKKVERGLFIAGKGA